MAEYYSFNPKTLEVFRSKEDGSRVLRNCTKQVRGRRVTVEIFFNGILGRFEGRTGYPKGTETQITFLDAAQIGPVYSLLKMAYGLEAVAPSFKSLYHFLNTVWFSAALIIACEKISQRRGDDPPVPTPVPEEAGPEGPFEERSDDLSSSWLAKCRAFTGALALPTGGAAMVMASPVRTPERSVPAKKDTPLKTAQELLEELMNDARQYMPRNPARR